MSLLVKKPNELLYKYINQFSSQSIDKEQKMELFPEGSFRLPNSKIRLAFHFTKDIPWVEIGSKKFSQPTQSIRGYQLNPVTFNTNDSFEVLTVEFTPHGFYNIFGISCSELTMAPICLESILQDDFQMLLHELYSKNLFSERVAFLEQYFLTKINPNWELEKAHNIYQLIQQKSSSLNNRKLAESTFSSERTLRRFFIKHFGLSPKSFIKFNRFEKSIRAVTEFKNNMLLTTALKYGYYDQAHFSNEFKIYMGISPDEFKKQLKTATNKGYDVHAS